MTTVSDLCIIQVNKNFNENKKLNEESEEK